MGRGRYKKGCGQGKGGDGKRGCGAEGQALTAAFPAPTVPSPAAAVGWDSPAGHYLPSCSPPAAPRCWGGRSGGGRAPPDPTARPGGCPAAGGQRHPPGRCPGSAGVGRPLPSPPLPPSPSSSWAPSASPGRWPPPCSQVRGRGAAAGRAGCAVPTCRRDPPSGAGAARRGAGRADSPEV